MGWFKCSTQLLNNKAFRKIGEPIKTRDPNSRSRKFIFLNIMCYSADGISFSSYIDLSNLLGISESTSEYVWNELKEMNILREKDGNWSCYDWMSEQGLFGRKIDYSNNSKKVKLESSSKSISAFDELFTSM